MPIMLEYRQGNNKWQDHRNLSSVGQLMGDMPVVDLVFTLVVMAKYDYKVSDDSQVIISTVSNSSIWKRLKEFDIVSSI